MPDAVHFTLITFSLVFVAVAGYYRIQSQRSGERLDRTREGWLLMIGIRLLGLTALVSTMAWLWKPDWFAWASSPIPSEMRWIGVAGFGFAITWLMWMFQTLGRNLTDTVVTRRNAYLVHHGPYRFVRNPMYTGILVAGVSLGFALGTWLVPLAASLQFGLLALRTRIEERFLIERFGDSYLTYMERVGRFAPKLSAVTGGK